MNTKLGWIVSGNSGLGSHCCTVKIDSNASDTIFNLKRFWTQEEILNAPSSLLNPDEQECEDFFVQTHSRDPTGRYVVRLPLKTSQHNLKFPGSYGIAVNTLRRTEARFTKDSIFRKAYIDFMIDSEKTGHMKVSKFLDSNSCFFLPHHGFVKKHGINPKFRSVFNGSAED